MARIREDQLLVPSVLDRLLDDDPSNTRELPKSRNQVLREMKQSVRRDLENLLNTRWRCVGWPAQYDQLNASVLNYGIPDFTGVVFTSLGEQERLRKTIEDVVRRCEPRFKTVSVKLISESGLRGRSIRFRIDALMYGEPAPEPVIFDTELETATGAVEIRDVRR